MSQAIRAKRFTWNEMAKDMPMPLLERRRVIGAQAMVSHVHLKKGCFVPTHAHPNEQITCLLSGRLRFVLHEHSPDHREEVTVVAGEVLHLPSNIPHSAEALEDTVVLDVFSPPSETTGIDRGH